VVGDVAAGPAPDRRLSCRCSRGQPRIRLRLCGDLGDHGAPLDCTAIVIHGALPHRGALLAHGALPVRAAVLVCPADICAPEAIFPTGDRLRPAADTAHDADILCPVPDTHHDAAVFPADLILGTAKLRGRLAVMCASP
jgi:hypothetical protein